MKPLLSSPSFIKPSPMQVCSGKPLQTQGNKKPQHKQQPGKRRSLAKGMGKRKAQWECAWERLAGMKMTKLHTHKTLSRDGNSGTGQVRSENRKMQWTESRLSVLGFCNTNPGSLEMLPPVLLAFPHRFPVNLPPTAFSLSLVWDKNSNVL